MAIRRRPCDCLIFRLSPCPQTAQIGRRISAAIRKTCLGPTWAARPNGILPLRLPMHATCSVRAARRRVQANAATTVWGKYVKGEMTGSKWSPANRPLPERAVTQRSWGATVIGDAAYSLGSRPKASEASSPSRNRRRRRRVHGQSRASTSRRFARTRTRAAVIEKASQDRRLAKAHVTVQMGGSRRQ